MVLLPGVVLPVVLLPGVLLPGVLEAAAELAEGTVGSAPLDDWALGTMGTVSLFTGLVTGCSASLSSDAAETMSESSSSPPCDIK